MTLLAQPLLAMIFGAFIICAETCLHAETILRPGSWVDLPIHDWVAGAFLVGSGAMSRRDWNKGRPCQAAAWAFMLSLLMAAFVGHWEEWSGGAPQIDEWVSAGAFVGILGGLLVLSAGGMAATLVTERQRG